MIPSSPLFKVIAAVSAVSVHIAVAIALHDGNAAVIEDRRGNPGEVRLGSSFQDWAVGVQSPETATDASQHPPVDGVLEPVSHPQSVETAEAPPETIASVTPTNMSETSQPENADRFVPGSALTAQSPTTAETAKAIPIPPETAPVALAQRLTSVAAVPVPVVEALEAQAVTPKPQLGVQPQSTTAAVIAPKPEALMPTNPEIVPSTTSLAPASSRRPPVGRPKTYENREVARVVQPTPPVSATATLGNNKARSERAGEADGTSDAQAITSGRDAAGTQSGNSAEASNYSGQVFACVARAVRRVSGSGTATISFSVTETGQVTNARASQSSGSARLDRALVRAVMRAKCGAPPAGAQRSFSVRASGA